MNTISARIVVALRCEFVRRRDIESFAVFLKIVWSGIVKIFWGFGRFACDVLFVHAVDTFDAWAVGAEEPHMAPHEGIALVVRHAVDAFHAGRMLAGGRKAVGV